MKQTYRMKNHHKSTYTVINTHLSLGRSLERKLHYTGCEDPGEVRHAQNHTLSLGHESYRGSLSPSHWDRRRRGLGMRERSGGRSGGGRARRKGRGGACRGRWKDVKKNRKVRRTLLGVRMRSECRSPPLSCYRDHLHHRLTLTPLKHTYTRRYAFQTCRHTQMHQLKKHKQKNSDELGDYSAQSFTHLTGRLTPSWNWWCHRCCHLPPRLHPAPWFPWRGSVAGHESPLRCFQGCVVLRGTLP